MQLNLYDDREYELREPIYDQNVSWDCQKYDRVGLIPYTEIMGRKYYCFVIDENRTLNDFSVSGEEVSISQFLSQFQHQLPSVWSFTVDNLKSSEIITSQNAVELIFQVNSPKSTLQLKSWTESLRKNGMEVSWFTLPQLSKIIRGEFEHITFCSINANLLSKLRENITRL